MSDHGHHRQSYTFTSLTRITHLRDTDFEVSRPPRDAWASGDYVVVRVTDPGRGAIKIEGFDGRMMDTMRGDLLVGALGKRHATLEATGDWEIVGDDGKMHLLTGAGLLGKATSTSAYLPRLITAEYRGHVSVDGEYCNMRDYVPDLPHRPLGIPVVLLVGTSMSAGKTTAARIIARELKRAGLEIVAAKLTGAGRYRDILTVKDAGADHIFDFVDAGLPSSIYPEDEYRSALQSLLSMIAETSADVAVVEIGASPLEPYNGDVAIEEIAENVRCSVLCASDPYAVYGVMESFEFEPTFVSGIATNTLAGVELIRELCGVPALNLVDAETIPELRRVLADRLDIGDFSAE